MTALWDLSASYSKVTSVENPHLVKTETAWPRCQPEELQTARILIYPVQLVSNNSPELWYSATVVGI